MFRAGSLSDGSDCRRIALTASNVSIYMLLGALSQAWGKIISESSQSRPAAQGAVDG
jgi:hypothetical protein